MTAPPRPPTVATESTINVRSSTTPPAFSAPTTAQTTNINVGLMGHVDAGKTSLARFISDVGSTAAFDRHPASQERGITLDLGFSRVTTDRGAATLVDCPGHASLLRMVLGAASIIDAVILVVDATEGIQAQTAECLVLAELVTRRLLVALTKVDKLASPEDLEKMTKDLRRALRETVFGREKQKGQGDNDDHDDLSWPPVPIVPVSPHLPETRTSFLEALGTFLFPWRIDGSPSWTLRRNLTRGPALVAIDHCFIIKGQGAVLTGTILRGSLRPGDMVEIGVSRITAAGEELAAPSTIPASASSLSVGSAVGSRSKPRPTLASANLRRIKSLQIFRRPVEEAHQGDRVGINLGSGLDTSDLERTLLATPGLVRTSRILLLRDLRPIRHYKYAPCRSRGRLHLSILHQTTLVTVIFLKRTSVDGQGGGEEYEFVDELVRDRSGPGGVPEEQLRALVTAPVPMMAISGAMAIASKLDIDQGQRPRGGGGRVSKVCRLIFAATVEQLLREDHSMRIYRWRQRMGTIDRLIDEHRLIGAGLSGTLAGLRQFIGMECVIVRAGEDGAARVQEWNLTGATDDPPIVVARGIVESPFGVGGKFNVNLTMALPQGSRRQDYLVMVRYKKYN